MHVDQHHHFRNGSTAAAQVDVRGPRFAAWVTSAVLLIVLVLSGVNETAAALLLGAQAGVFLIGALHGPRRHLYGRIFATLVAPRLGPVSEREPVQPLRFAQLVGLLFALVGTAGFVFGAPLIGVVATAFRLTAAFQRGVRDLSGLSGLPAHCPAKTS